MEDWMDVLEYLVKSFLGLVTLVAMLAFAGLVLKLMSIPFLWGWRLIR